MRWILPLLVLTISCRHQPLAYSLKKEGLTQLLTPPPSKPEIKNARAHPARKEGCDVEAESYSVAWHGNTARVAVKNEAYYAATPPPQQQQVNPTITIAETGPRMYSDILAQIEKFRDALAAREDSGCFRDDEAARLRQSISETFPLPPQIAAFLRFGTYMQTGFIDLMPDFVVRLVIPTPSDPDVAFYEAKGIPGDDRVRLILASGPGKALTAPEKPAYFRYLYWTGGETHFRTTIIGVQERSQLRDATSQFLSAPETYCSTTKNFCQSITTSVGMNAGFYVSINGKNAFVRLGGSLAEAVGEATNGMRLIRGLQPILQNVTVRRLFHGKLIPIKVDSTTNVLSVTAMPGDEITVS